jgi:PKD repeat protein
VTRLLAAVPLALVAALAIAAPSGAAVPAPAPIAGLRATCTTALGATFDIPEGTTTTSSVHGLGAAGSGASDVAVSGRTGQATGVRVTIPVLTGVDLAHLTGTLIGPGGRSAVLFAEGDLTGTSLQTHVFDVTADLLPPADANGTWTLRIDTDDDVAGKASLGERWHLDVDTPDCHPETKAIVSVDPAIAAPGEPVTIDASQSTSDVLGEPPATYDFDLDGDGAYEPRADASDPVETLAYGAVGHHLVHVRVTAQDGSTDVADIDVVVTHPPTADISVPAGPLHRDTPITLDGSGSSDPDGPIAIYEWAEDGAAFASGDPTHDVSLATPGDHHVALRVTDADGGTATTTATVTIDNRPPTAGFTVVDAPLTGQATHFSATAGSDPDGDAIAAYHWDFGDGTSVTTATAAATHTYATPGARTVTLTVTDSQGADSAPATRLLTVVQAPIARIVPDAEPATAGVPVTFDGATSTGTDATSAITRYQWDLDGVSGYEVDSSSPTAVRTYPSAGVLTVRLRVTDAEGHSAEMSFVLHVQDPPADPTPPAGPGGGSGSGTAPPVGGTPTGGGGAPTGTHPGGGGMTGGTTTTPKQPPARFTAVLAGAPIQALKRVLEMGVVMTCRASRAARCALRLQISARDARRLKLGKRKGKRPVVLARATVSARAGVATRVVLRVRGTAAKRLRRAKRVTVTVAGVATATGAPAATLARAVLVRRR